MYSKTLWYQTQLSRRVPEDGMQRVPEDGMQLTEKVTHETSAVKSLLCRIQAELQTAGVRLNQPLELKSIDGQYLINNF